jgi:hypothetical protein
MYLLETVKLFARRKWEDDDPDSYLERHTQWLFSRIRAHRPEEYFTSVDFSMWMLERHDDRRLVEDRLIMARRFDEFAELVGASWLTAWNQTNSQALVMLDRLEHILATTGLTEAQSAALHLTASGAAMPARRPEWFVRGSAAAIEHYRNSPGYEALSTALTVASFMRSFGDLAGALELLDEARLAAQAVGAARVAGLTAAYRALLLSVHGDRGEALDVVEEAEREFGGPVDHVYSITESARFVIHVFDEPARASAVFDQPVRGHPHRGIIRPFMVGCTAAVEGDLRRAESMLSEAEAVLRASGKDDGLPDILLVPALAAWKVGELGRATRWVTAIRHADRPTQSFNATGAYRQLRDRAGLLDENPLETDTIQEIYGEARDWLHELATHH